jgi:hypothetical protein
MIFLENASEILSFEVFQLYYYYLVLVVYIIITKQQDKTKDLMISNAIINTN